MFLIENTGLFYFLGRSKTKGLAENRINSEKIRQLSSNGEMIRGKWQSDRMKEELQNIRASGHFQRSKSDTVNVES